MAARLAAVVLQNDKKKKTHPHKLAVIWKKGKAKYSTKPVPWQANINSHVRGVHVWPEPDPVESKLTLFKNTEEKLVQYQDKNWNILVQSVSPRGKRKLMATGCIDVSDYITGEKKKFDITVTLQPANKNVLSGQIEFELSSVMLEDGLPRRTDEEIMKEIMEEAREELARKKSARKVRSSRSVRRKSSKMAANSNRDSPSGTDSFNDTTLSDNAADEENKNEVEAGGARLCDGPQVDSSNNNTRPGQRKIRKKAPPPPRPASPRPASSQSRPTEPHPSDNQELPLDS